MDLVLNSLLAIRFSLLSNPYILQPLKSPHREGFNVNNQEIVGLSSRNRCNVSVYGQ